MDISSQGRQVSKISTNDTELPSLESLAMPKWYGEYHPDAMDLTAESDMERWKNEPDLMRSEYLAKNSFRREHSQEIDEYQSQLNSYFNEACEKHGINPGRYCNRDLNANPEIYEQIHNDVKENLAGDSRMMELMGLLGIDL